jgi:hypothetical protein
MHQNDVFFIFEKLFSRSAHHNDPKHIKNNFLTKKIKIFKKHGLHLLSKEFLYKQR